jgi:Ulp1 family protease
MTIKTQKTKFAYDGVRRWWKGIDLFAKDFLVVPISLHLHWSSMIICHPGRFKTMLDYELDHAIRVDIERKQKKERKEEKKKRKKEVERKFMSMSFQRMIS